MTASEWRLGDWPDPRSGDAEPVRIVERPGYTSHELGRLPIVVRYAVVRAGWIATRDHEWTLEPQPSSRDDAFYAATRFDDWEDAAAHAQRMATTYREAWDHRGGE
jgi:hypothetical protein